MYKILYRQQPIDRINGYSKRYREYYEERFTDTGIFSESILRDMYVAQSLERREELFALIEERLAIDIILGRTADNTLGIPWRQKMLYVLWEETSDTRIVTDLTIR